jgi:hypothetical protein
MVFEKLEPYIDEIEVGLRQNKSPRKIADELGDPKLYQTIRRYKLSVFDLKKEANSAFNVERQKTYEQRLEEGKLPMVDTLEVINLAKLRAKQLLDINLGDTFKTSSGKEHELTYGSASIYWETGARILKEMVKLEMEIAGDDPESRKADAIESVTNDDIETLLQALERS